MRQRKREKILRQIQERELELDMERSVLSKRFALGSGFVSDISRIKQIDSERKCILEGQFWLSLLDRGIR